MRYTLLFPLIVIAALAASCRKDTVEAPVDFATQIKPLLESHCINCHHSGALFGNLNLENRAAAFRTRPKGPVITPGQPEKSPLYVVLTLPAPSPKAMPPMDHDIPQAEVELVKRWIQQGASWPEGAEGTLKPMAQEKPAT